MFHTHEATRPWDDEESRFAGGAGHPLRRLRHPPVAGLARELPQAALAAHLRALADRRKPRCARVGPGFAPPDRRLQPGAPLPGRRAAARAPASQTPRIVLEPVGRNSAPAIAAAALLVAEDDPDAVLWMMAADAAIADIAALHARPAIAAVAAARAGRIVTFGMRPTAAGNRLRLYRESAPPLRRRARRPRRRPLHRKAGRRAPPRAWSPTAGTCGTPACSCSPRGRCSRSWSATRPTCCRRCARRWRRGGTTSTSSASTRQRSPPRPSISLDYAVAERTARAAVVPADIGWSDVGSWNALWELGAQGRGRQRRGRRRAAGRRQQLLRAQRRHADRGGRAERRRGGGDRGRGAGDAPRPGAGREEGRGPAEGRRPARGGGA